MAKEKKRNLNKEERIFIDEYIKEFNAARAYRLAFPERKKEFSRTYGPRFRKRPHIQDEINRLIEEGMSTLEEDVMKNVNFWIKMRDDPEAKETSRLKASEMLAKYRGQFTEKHEHSHEGTINIVDDI